MVFFFDENMPSRLANALHAIEGAKSNVSVFHTGEYFDRGIKDPDLILKIKEVNGIWITQDSNIRKNEGEIGLIRDEGVSVIIIGFGANSKFTEIYQFIFKYWEKIKEECRQHREPFVCKLMHNGDFKYYD
jgi:hypothetical protein